MLLYNIGHMEHDEELETIEGVIISERLDEAPQQGEAKKPLDDYQKQITRYSYMANLFLRYGPTLFAVTILATLAFWILAQQDGYQGFFFVMMIVAAALAGVGLIAFVFGLVCRKIAIKYMKLDPNYSGRQ